MNDVIDVSRYQGTIDWAAVKASGKIGGAMLKSVSTNKSFGGIYIDPTFEQNYTDCKANNIPVGTYFYTYALDTATMDKELAKLKEALTGKSFTLPIAIDVEDNKLKSLDVSALTKLIAYAADVIESWGVYVIIYTYTSFADRYLDMNALKAYDVWIADYRKNRPTITHGMWQYTSTGSVSGVSGNVDISHVYKNYPSIIKRKGLMEVKA